MHPPSIYGVLGIAAVSLATTIPQHLMPSGLQKLHCPIKSTINLPGSEKLILAASEASSITEAVTREKRLSKRRSGPLTQETENFFDLLLPVDVEFRKIGRMGKTKLSLNLEADTDSSDTIIYLSTIEDDLRRHFDDIRPDQQIEGVTCTGGRAVTFRVEVGKFVAEEQAICLIAEDIPANHPNLPGYHGKLGLAIAPADRTIFSEQQPTFYSTSKFGTRRTSLHRIGIELRKCGRSTYHPDYHEQHRMFKMARLSADPSIGRWQTMMTGYMIGTDEDGTGKDVEWETHGQTHGLPRLASFASASRETRLPLKILEDFYSPVGGKMNDKGKWVYPSGKTLPDIHLRFGSSKRFRNSGLHLDLGQNEDDYSMRNGALQLLDDGDGIVIGQTFYLEHIVAHSRVRTWSPKPSDDYSLSIVEQDEALCASDTPEGSRPVPDADSQEQEVRECMTLVADEGPVAKRPRWGNRPDTPAYDPNLQAHYDDSSHLEITSSASNPHEGSHDELELVNDEPSLLAPHAQHASEPHDNDVVFSTISPSNLVMSDVPVPAKVPEAFAGLSGVLAESKRFHSEKHASSSERKSSPKVFTLRGDRNNRLLSEISDEE